MDEYDIGQAFKEIEEQLISSMMRNMDRHKMEEGAYGFNWPMWQAEQLKSLEKYRVKNKMKFEGSFAEINRSIEGAVKGARAAGGMKEEARILKTIQKNYKTQGRNGFGARRNKKLSAKFFKVNDRKMDALIRATTHDFQKAETAMLRMANDQYRKIIFKAQVFANSGAGTYKQAVDMAAKDFLSAGINCVEYKDGSRHTVKEYTQMSIRTANKRAALTGEGEKRNEYGVHTVIINRRSGACERCLPFVGVVFIDDVWSGGNSKDGTYPLLSSAISAGLFHPNCKDGTSTYYPGITPIESKYTKEETDKILEKSKAEAKQKYVARQAEKYDRLSRHSMDDENRTKYQNISNRWKAVMRNSSYSKFTDMLQDYNNGQKDTISHWSIQKNLNKSDVGKDAVKYIVEHPELRINLCYKVDAPENTLGIQDGDDIFVYASKTATIQKTTETLIHEITHHKYNIGGNQWAECVCRAQELKHRNKTDKLTGQELRDIIKSVKRDYPKMKWR